MPPRAVPGNEASTSIPGLCLAAGSRIAALYSKEARPGLGPVERTDAVPNQDRGREIFERGADRFEQGDFLRGPTALDPAPAQIGEIALYVARADDTAAHRVHQIA